MGYDVTLHPVSLGELNHFLFDVIESPSLLEPRLSELIAAEADREVTRDVFQQAFRAIEATEDEVRKHLDDDHYRALQIALLLRPEQGALIAGSGGLRKIRWGRKGEGKRGGFRVIYFWHKPSGRCFMLFLYGKNEQGDLTADQTRALSRLVREEFP